MPTARELTDPHLSTYTNVSRVGEGVCRICHGAPAAGFRNCYSCHQTTQQVSRPLRFVVPISLYRVGEQLWYVLRHYKDHTNAQVRQAFKFQVAAIIALFLAAHAKCIANEAQSDWDLVTTVPSSKGRVAPHPLDEAIALIPSLRPILRTLLRPGKGKVDHNTASDTGFEVAEDIRGRTILLLDDTFTSGARLQSAASALGLAGANVTGALVVGRVIAPDFSEASKELWYRMRGSLFTFDRCCLEPDV
jgi:predicted amidophosphoribosyltransferase